MNFVITEFGNLSNLSDRPWTIMDGDFDMTFDRCTYEHVMMKLTFQWCNANGSSTAERRILHTSAPHEKITRITKAHWLC